MEANERITSTNLQNYWLL